MGGRFTSSGNRSEGSGRGSGRGNTHYRKNNNTTVNSTAEKKEMNFTTNVTGSPSHAMDLHFAIDVEVLSSFCSSESLLLGFLWSFLFFDISFYVSSH